MSEDRLERIESKIDKFVDVQIDLKVDVASIKKDVNTNTKDLSKHIEGVVQNRKRIEKLETPAIVFNALKWTAIWIAAIASVFVAFKDLNIL